MLPNLMYRRNKFLYTPFWECVIKVFKTKRPVDVMHPHPTTTCTRYVAVSHWKHLQARVEVYLCERGGCLQWCGWGRAEAGRALGPSRVPGQLPPGSHHQWPEQLRPARLHRGMRQRGRGEGGEKGWGGGGHPTNKWVAKKGGRTVWMLLWEILPWSNHHSYIFIHDRHVSDGSVVDVFWMVCLHLLGHCNVSPSGELTHIAFSHWSVVQFICLLLLQRHSTKIYVQLLLNSKVLYI